MQSRQEKEKHTEHKRLDIIGSIKSFKKKGFIWVVTIRSNANGPQVERKGLWLLKFCIYFN